MPRLSPADELRQMQVEHARLTKIVDTHGKQLDALDKLRREIGMVFTANWTRRNWIERRMFLLLRKVKECKPVRTERKPAVEKSAAELLTKLTPAQIALLRAILEKE